MDSHRRTALTALALGAAVVIPVASPAYAHARHPAAHAARHHRVARPTDAATDDLALPADLAGSDADYDTAPDFAPAPLPGRRPSGIAGRLARWVAGADDNGDLPFMIVDKLGAHVYAFDASGDFLGSAPVLLGLARGDDSAPGLGGLQLSQISDEERTTPAGRFVSEFGRSEGHGTMLWVDFADAISMHPVMSVNAGEHRLERIKSADPDAHRISYGCINVPKSFYDGVVLPALEGGHAVVYVMPDTKPVAEVFPAFAAATSVGHERGQPARHVSSADLLSDPPDRIPDPEPSRFDRVDARLTMAPPM